MVGFGSWRVLSFFGSGSSLLTDIEIGPASAGSEHDQHYRKNNDQHFLALGRRFGRLNGFRFIRHNVSPYQMRSAIIPRNFQ
jgi:hypothetical protein